MYQSHNPRASEVIQKVAKLNVNLSSALYVLETESDNITTMEDCAKVLFDMRNMVPQAVFAQRIRNKEKDLSVIVEQKEHIQQTMETINQVFSAMDSIAKSSQMLSTFSEKISCVQDVVETIQWLSSTFRQNADYQGQISNTLNETIKVVDKSVEKLQNILGRLNTFQQAAEDVASSFKQMNRQMQSESNTEGFTLIKTGEFLILCHKFNSLYNEIQQEYVASLTTLRSKAETARRANTFNSADGAIYTASILWVLNWTTYSQYLIQTPQNFWPHYSYTPCKRVYVYMGDVYISGSQAAKVIGVNNIINQSIQRLANFKEVFQSFVTSPETSVVTKIMKTNTPSSSSPSPSKENIAPSLWQLSDSINMMNEAQQNLQSLNYYRTLKEAADARSKIGKDVGVLEQQLKTPIENEISKISKAVKDMLDTTKNEYIQAFARSSVYKSASE